MVTLATSCTLHNMNEHCYITNLKYCKALGNFSVNISLFILGNYYILYPLLILWPLHSSHCLHVHDYFFMGIYFKYCQTLLIQPPLGHKNFVGPPFM